MHVFDSSLGTLISVLSISTFFSIAYKSRGSILVIKHEETRDLTILAKDVSDLSFSGGLREVFDIDVIVDL